MTHSSTTTANLRSFGKALGALALAGGMTLAASGAAEAALTVEGITYNLYMGASGTLTKQFTLTIDGINAASDTRGGRSGVGAIAFNRPNNYLSAIAPAGFTLVNGGLNASGCNGSGNFFCFDNSSIPPVPATALAAGTSLSYVFTVTISSGNFNGYAPDFKIDWVGSQNNYDLVSRSLSITPGTPPTPGANLPEPATLALLGAGLVGLGLARRRRAA